MKHPTPNTTPMNDRYECPHCGSQSIKVEAEMVGYLDANELDAEVEDAGGGFEHDGSRHGAACRRCGHNTWEDPDKLTADAWRRPCTFDEAVWDIAADVIRGQSPTARDSRFIYGAKELRERWPGISEHEIDRSITAAEAVLTEERGKQ